MDRLPKLSRAAAATEPPLGAVHEPLIHGPPGGDGRAPAGNESVGSVGMARYLTEDRERIAQGLNQVVCHRLFAAGLDLQTALGLVGDHHGTDQIRHAISELDQAIKDLRDTVFDWAPAPGSRVSRPGGAGAAAVAAETSRLRVSLDLARGRRGAVDGGWWPQSRKAVTELPALIAALEARPGLRVQRLAIHRDDWDEIPRRLSAGGGHVIRVEWFTTIARHTVSVTAADRATITLLVVPPGTAEGAARAAMNTAAAAGVPGTAQATDILTASAVAAREQDPGASLDPAE